MKLKQKLLVIFWRRWFHIRQETPNSKMTLLLTIDWPMWGWYLLSETNIKDSSKTFPGLRLIFSGLQISHQSLSFPRFKDQFSLQYVYSSHNVILKTLFVELSWFQGISRTCSLFPGLSSPGKCQNKIPGPSRFSEPCLYLQQLFYLLCLDCIFRIQENLNQNKKGQMTWQPKIMYKYIAQFKKCLSSRDMPRWRKTLQVGWSFIGHESSSDQAA